MQAIPRGVGTVQYREGPIFVGGIVSKYSVTPTDMLVLVGPQHDTAQVEPRFLSAMIASTGRFDSARERRGLARSRSGSGSGYGYGYGNLASS